MFDVQLFNFKKKKYASSSSVLFNTKFLNIYFLKQAKSKMLERMTTIIFGNLNHEDYFYKIYKNDTENKINPYENENILLQWKSYLALANFVKVRSTYFKLKENNNDLFYFGKNIPLIINQNYLEQYKSKVPDVCYHQLQFIFDALYKKEFVYRFHENILKTERIIQKNKLPRYDIIAKSIKAKNISLIMQIQRYNEFLDRKSSNKNDVLRVYFSI